MEGDRIWMWVAAALLCTTMAASYAAINYYSQATSYEKNYQMLLEDLDDLTIIVNLRIDYGNGTVIWHNNTRVPLNTTLLTATLIVASVDYSTSDLGAFVNNINGVGEDPQTYWIWSFWDSEKGSWEMGPTGCDKWILHKGDKVSWTYTSF